MLYATMPASVAANILTSLLFVNAQWSAIDHVVLAWWFSGSVFIIFLRAILLLAYKKVSPFIDNMPIWGYRFNIGSLASGLMLGLAGVFLFPENNLVHQIMCAFVLVPLFLRLAIEDTDLYYILMFMLVFAFSFMLRSPLQIYRNTEQNIILRLQAYEREEELLKAQQRQDLHIENTPLGFIEWVKGFRVRAWNPSAENIFGFAKQVALEKHAKDLIFPDDVIIQAVV